MVAQLSRDLSGGGGVPAVRPPFAPTLKLDGRPDDMPVQIGNWDLVRMLGSGSEADVFLAQHRTNARRVAVKLIRHGASSYYDRRRHLDEIRAIIAIDHRNVVRLFEAGELDDRRIYLVMEHLEGQTLRNVLDQRGRLGASVLLQIGLLVARGLGAAHARGIVHRDLKPSNVMVTPSGSGRFTIKLIDFGIAKLIDGKATTIVGTPAYMSPEQERGDAIDHRTDIYSFGVLLHRASTGGYPDRDRIDASPRASDCTLQTIIARCLRRDPAERFPTTAHLIAELETARARLGRVRPARGTPSDNQTTAWWLRDDTVFSTHQRPPSSTQDATAVRAKPPPIPPRARPRSPEVLAPAPLGPIAPTVAARKPSPSGPMVAPRATSAPSMPPARPLVVNIEPRTRLLIIAVIALGVLLGVILPLLRGDDPPPPAPAPVVQPPPPPPALAPPPPAAIPTCAPPEPGRLGPPGRALAAWTDAPDEPPKPRKPKKRDDDEVEIEIEDE